ncbi:PIG-L family deacetylase, partial [Solihabitans fulvus]
AGLAPWDGVRWVAVAASPEATHAADITDTLDRAVDSLREHRAYLAALGGTMAEPEPFLRGMAESTGERFGGRLA